MTTPPGAPSGVPPNLVVLDTDVYSRLYVRSADPNSQLRELRDQLAGLVPVIATQTLAELRAWPLLKSWSEQRTARFMALLAGTTVVPLTDEIIQAYAELYVRSRATGHALHQRVHSADRWVAATAVALDRPLVSLDGIYTNAPLVKLLPAVQ